MTLAHDHWAHQVDGGHRHSTEEWFQQYADEIAAITPIETRADLKTVLVDVGCGSCQVTTYLAKRFHEVYALDFSDAMLAAARERIAAARQVKNIHILKGDATSFPPDIKHADLILSYGVVQYLTLETFAAHLSECNRVLAENGVICVANIPDRARRDIFYRRINPPWDGNLTSYVRRNFLFAQTRVKAFFNGDFLWDGVGNWFTTAQIVATAESAGYRTEIVNSKFYEYRFHAILHPSATRL